MAGLGFGGDWAGTWRLPRPVLKPRHLEHYLYHAAAVPNVYVEESPLHQALGATNQTRHRLNIPVSVGGGGGGTGDSGHTQLLGPPPLGSDQSRPTVKRY